LVFRFGLTDFRFLRGNSD